MVFVFPKAPTIPEHRASMKQILQSGGAVMVLGKLRGVRMLAPFIAATKALGS